MTRKFTRKPKAPAAPGVEDFIGGAAVPSDPMASDMAPHGTESFDALPWNRPRVRADMLKVYNLRLPEPYLLKLKFIAENTPGSMHRFCLDALLPAIDAEVERLTQRRA